MVLPFDENSLRLVQLLFTHFDERLYLRKIARESGVSTSTASRALDALAKADVVRKAPSGNQTLFWLNPGNPLTLSICLMALSLKLEGIRTRNEAIYQQIVSFADSCSKALGNNLHSVVLFGSAARGERAGDLDLLVIAPLEHTKKVEEVAHTIGASYTKQLSPTIIDSAAFEAELGKNALLYVKIVKEGIPIYGGEAYLKKAFTVLEKK